ncbi:Pup--protein ligase [Bowdeniella nasicola]|uniref:Pup--protein ligase n=1 Tax=Bowdeniella nasicola TaxID=208480 RepID=A0A1Q5Q590_9ACTO|nr:Pup--protein ligase [Bowdeniella nasicola]OKL54859.1 Pup--protein ligase [Bowdeniella nasicola]
MSQRRIYGIETEYGITCANTGVGEPPLGAEEAAHELFRPVQASSRSTNAFLTNGGRLYLDVGAHPEYATAECDNLPDLLAQDRAGSMMMADLAAQANKRLRQRGISGAIHLFRNNADSRGNSYGCHENYLVRRTPRFRQMVDSLIPYFVTRQVVVGSGYLKLKRRRASYGFSQRADQTWDAISSATTRSRPIVNTRDEPHADADKYRRLHVIVGDTNVSEAATLAKVAVTELLLTLAERGELPRFCLIDPMRAIREVCQDISGTVRCDLDDGRALTAVDIQRHYLDAIAGADLEFTDLHRYSLDLWERGLNAVASQDSSAVDTELDWAVKKKLLDSLSARGFGLDSFEASRLMLAYHDVTSGGIWQRMEQRGMLRRFTTDADVDAARTTAPTTTRAHLRGQFLTLAAKYRRDHTVDWTHIRLNDANHQAIRLDDPFSASDDRVAALLAEIPPTESELPWA